MSLQTISEAVKTALQKDLPNMVGEELRAFIAAAQDNERKLEAANVRIEELKQRGNELQDQLSKHRSYDDKINEIATREKKLADGELELLRSTIENRAVIAEEKLKTGLDVMGLALRNVEIRRNVFGTEAVAVPATPAGTQYPGSQGTHAFSTTVPTTSTTTETQT